MKCHGGYFVWTAPLLFPFVCTTLSLAVARHLRSRDNPDLAELGIHNVRESRPSRSALQLWFVELTVVITLYNGYSTSYTCLASPHHAVEGGTGHHFAYASHRSRPGSSRSALICGSEISRRIYIVQIQPRKRVIDDAERARPYPAQARSVSALKYLKHVVENGDL